MSYVPCQQYPISNKYANDSSAEEFDPLFDRIRYPQHNQLHRIRSAS